MSADAWMRLPDSTSRPALPPSPPTGGTRAIRLRPRSTAAILLCSVTGLMAFAWPLLVDPGSGLAHKADAPLVLALLLPLLLAVVLAEISEGGLDIKAIALLGVLSAVGAALRPLGAGTAGLETVFFLLILGGRVFGAGFGFVLGATTLFASALVTGGVGPWLPFQMLGAAWVGWGAGLLPGRRGGPRSVCSRHTAPWPAWPTGCFSISPSGPSPPDCPASCPLCPAPHRPRTSTASSSSPSPPRSAGTWVGP